MSFLLDTCVVSELTKRRCDPGVVEWMEEQDETRLFVSTVTVGELEKGLVGVADPTRRRRLREFLEVDIVERFRERTLQTDEAVWRRWGLLCGRAEDEGAPLPAIDALIAAVAQVHGLTVVTRNEDDFARCDVPVLNPWSR
ncbi:MAG: type II toxin-antitoxin system VapC family toxin [Archangium sp.]|nr:type II toxin-antitoxin system VapC family toxin [Archangium sp.]